MVFAAVLLAPGLALGSFLNVVAARVPLRRSVVRPGSACMSCGAGIGWRDNVPLLSWLLLRGRCRSCTAAISWRYPAVEVATAALVAACVWKYGVSLEALVAGAFCTALIAVSATDLEHRIVPNRIVLPAAVVVLAAQTVLHPSLEWAAAGFGAAAFLFTVALVYPGGMGMVAALAPTIVLFARHGAKARKLAIPFAPFLALGSLLALFAGDAVLDWYL